MKEKKEKVVISFHYKDGDIREREFEDVREAKKSLDSIIEEMNKDFEKELNSMGYTMYKETK